LTLRPKFCKVKSTIIKVIYLSQNFKKVKKKKKL